MVENWRSANELAVVSATFEVDGDDLVAMIEMPERDLPPDEYRVKVFIEGERAAAMGFAKIEVVEGDGAEEDF
jgi:hypothetical protein